MPSNPLLFVVTGLAFILAPAAFVGVAGDDASEEAVPNQVVTRGQAHDDCLENSLMMPNGGRIGCTSMNAPTRRTDASGALFVTVGQKRP
ncbi:MAG: hypothetical protein AAGA15_12285 [Pseudomonadota bacterium]